MRRRILFVQFTDPAGYPPLEHASGLLAQRGWNIVFLGLRSRAQRLEFASSEKVSIRRIRLVAAGWRQKLQYCTFALWTILWACFWRPQWIYASDPASCPIAWWARKFAGTRLIYHEHDSPSSESGQSWFMTCVLSYRRKVAVDADLCILPQQTRLRRFVDSTSRAKPSVCVWNCPSLKEIELLLPDEKAPSHGGRLIAYFHGSITRDRVPVQLIVAASRFRGAVRIRIAGYETLGSIGYVRELMALATNNGASGIVEPLGTLRTRRELFEHASQAHFGCALMPMLTDDVNLHHMVGASNKPFDYMACSLPLLVSDLPEWNETFVKPGFGLSCVPDDVDSVEEALRWYIDNPNRRREMGLRGREKVLQTWNYETAFAPAVEAIENR